MVDITIYDGNNWFRRRMASSSGNVLSECFHEAHYKEGLKIFVWDGYGHLESRRKIYPEYKTNREKASEDIYASMNTFKKLLHFSNCFSIEIKRFEADDIIAKLARQYSNEGHNVFIESNDGDFAQLGLPMARKEFKVEPEWVILYKILVGDSSDNIKGVKGFGQKTWDGLTVEQKQILYAIVNCYTAQNEAVVRSKIEGFLPPAIVNWISDKDNRKILSDYNKIINFLPVPDELVKENTKMGINRPELTTSIFSEIEI